MVTRKFKFVHQVSSPGSVNNWVALDLNRLDTYSLAFAELSDLYRFFRFNSMTVKAFCTTQDSTGPIQDHQYYHLQWASNVAASSLVGDTLHFSSGKTWYFSTTNGCPGKDAVLRLPRSVLHTNVEWFTTLHDDADDEELNGPGNVYLIYGAVMASADILSYIEVEMDVTFRGQLDPETIAASIFRRLGQTGAESVEVVPVTVPGKGGTPLLRASQQSMQQRKLPSSKVFLLNREQQG